MINCSSAGNIFGSFSGAAYSLVQLYVRNIRLDRMIKLRSFSTRVYITTRGGYLEEDHPFKFLGALFNGGPQSLQKVQLSFFHRFGDEADEGAPEATGWSELDSALTSMPGLQEVSVVVCCTQCAPDEIRAHEDVYDLPLLQARGVTFNRRFTDVSHDFGMSQNLLTTYRTLTRRLKNEHPRNDVNHKRSA